MVRAEEHSHPLPANSPLLPASRIGRRAADRTPQSAAATAPLALRRGRIDVWYVFLDAFRDAGAALAMLDRREIERYDRFASEDAARQFLAGRALMRTALSRYTGVPARSWRFAATAHGRLFVDEPRRHRDLFFNLSHCSQLAALAVGRSPEIGIDVEAIGRCVDIEGVGRSVFAQSEADWVLLSPGSERDRFFDLWTLKEAYIKARGLGFSLPPKTFALVGRDGRFGLRCDRNCDPRPERWQFRLSSPRPDLRVALAIGSHTATPIRTLTVGAPEPGSCIRLDDNPFDEVT